MTSIQHLIQRLSKNCVQETHQYPLLIDVLRKWWIIRTIQFLLVGWGSVCLTLEMRVWIRSMDGSIRGRRWCLGIGVDRIRSMSCDCLYTLIIKINKNEYSPIQSLWTILEDTTSTYYSSFQTKKKSISSCLSSSKQKGTSESISFSKEMYLKLYIDEKERIRDENMRMIEKIMEIKHRPNKLKTNPHNYSLSRQDNYERKR